MAEGERQCRTRGDAQCLMRPAGYASGRRHGQLWRCPTCGRMVDNRGNVVCPGEAPADE